MSGSNKILTVSYGTFSCTLEGFDEPFDTMRGIAEYFRDLAADDRYFGAEPPTPDAEMLQAIAQRDVRQRVEARTSETGIALTQTGSSAAAPAQTPEPAPKQAGQDDTGSLAYEDEYLMSDEPEDILTVDQNIPAADGTDRVETVAEKLRRIRAVVSRSVEPGDIPNSFSTAPDADGDAGASPVRDQASTHTIDAITADLSDEYVFDEDREANAEAAADLDDAVVDQNDLEDLSRMDGADDIESDEVNNLMAHDATASEGDAENAFAEHEEAEADSGEAESSGDEAEASNDEAGSDEPEADIDEDAPSSDEDLIASVMQAGQATDGDEPSSDTHWDAASKRDGQRSIDGSDDSVDRLLKETDNQFADRASIRRRRVISQMRAAVAATKAEQVMSRVISKGTLEAEQSSPYKSDLKQAISRAVSATPPKSSDVADTDLPTSEQATRPLAQDKAAPLVLVSSQRVDSPVEQARVEHEPAAEGSFSEFAKEMGASDLLDLMEAAAAYSSFVEGEPHFSRPDIMKRVARVDPALEISREAGLRSFGQLLRQGKIRKLDRGQFVVDEETRFNPGQRIAGE